MFEKNKNLLQEKSTVRDKAIFFGKIYLKICLLFIVVIVAVNIINIFYPIKDNVFNLMFPQFKEQINIISDLFVEDRFVNYNEIIKNIEYEKYLSISRNGEKEGKGKFIYKYKLKGDDYRVVIDWNLDQEYLIKESDIERIVETEE